MKISVAVVLLSMASVVPNSGFAATPSADLTGHVMLPADKSIRATILISYARLKTNSEPSIADRYPILPVKAQTDRQGNFEIASLDPRWLYSGGVMAPGCRLQELKEVDPAAGLLQVSLQTVDTNAAPNQVIHGRVITAGGHPVSGAVIAIRGTTRNGQMTWPGSDVDYYSVSDDTGNFVIYGKTPFAAVDGEVHADGFAEASFEQWPSDAATEEWKRTGSMPEGLASFAKPLHEIVLTEGASLRGRLMHSGKPVADAEVLLNGCGTGSGCWNWKPAVLTDANGRFVFTHLPPNQTWSICGTWDLLTRAGAVPETDVKTGENGSTQDIGDINLKSVCEVAGKVHLSDGKAIPHGAVYFLAWDNMGGSLPSAIGEDGSFQFPAIPGDEVSLYLRVNGYELHPGDSRLISGSVTNFTVRPQMTDLEIKMEPFSRVSAIAN